MTVEEEKVEPGSTTETLSRRLRGKGGRGEKGVRNGGEDQVIREPAATSPMALVGV